MILSNGCVNNVTNYQNSVMFYGRDEVIFALEYLYTNKLLKMKKLTFCIIATIMLLSIIPTPVKAAAAAKTVTVVAPETVQTTDVGATQLARLEKIKAMDLSTLSRTEKKELRNEVRAIKSDQDGRGRRGHDGRGGRNYDGRHGGGAVFVMGGGGLLILLLIIILL